MDKGFKIENERYYSSLETARICNIGRTTLLRIEEKGFDTPRIIDKETGKRYYDVVNINRIMQYQMFQKLGLTTKEMLSYYNGDTDRENFLEMLRERVAIAQRCLDEFESRLTERDSLTFSYVEIPESTCYFFSCDIPIAKDQIEYNYCEIQRMYDMGFKPFPTTPMASVIPDLYTIYDGTNTNPFRQTICLSIYPDPIPDPSRVVHTRKRYAFSLLYHGNDDQIMRDGGRILWEEMQRKGIRANGPLVGVCVNGPFFGTDLDPRDYIFRWAIPIDE